MKSKIVISVRHGFVEDISGIPDDVLVEVRDFDVMTEESVIYFDGEPAYVETWENASKI